LPGAARSTHRPLETVGESWLGRAGPCLARQGSAGQCNAMQNHGAVKRPEAFKNIMEPKKTIIDYEGAVAEVTASNTTKTADIVTKCVESMVAEIKPGASWTIEQLSEWLQKPVGSMQLGFRISEVNKTLESDHGYHLTSRGKHGLKYFAEPLERSRAIARNMARDGMAMINKRSVLYANGVLVNHGDALTESEKRKLEKDSQIYAMRYVLASRLK